MRQPVSTSEVEYTVLGVVDDGLADIEAIRDHVLSNVRAVSDDQADAADDAIDRLVEKHILEREETTVRLR